MNPNVKGWSDEKLERRIRRDADHAHLWNELFRRLYPRLFLAAQRITHNADEADLKDLVQETLIDMWSQCESVVRIENLHAYIFRILDHKCRRWVRDRGQTRLRFNTPLEREGEEDRPIEAVPHPGAAVVDSMASEEEVGMALEQVCIHFTKHPEDWQMIRWKHIVGSSHAQIADRLQVSEETARKRLARAVDRFRRLCKKHEITSDAWGEAIFRYNDICGENDEKP